MNNRLRNILGLIQLAKDIRDNELLSPEKKFDLIFGLRVADFIRIEGYHFDWYDPDTSYEDDYCSYVKALEEFRDSLELARRL